MVLLLLGVVISAFCWGCDLELGALTSGDRHLILMMKLILILILMIMVVLVSGTLELNLAVVGGFLLAGRVKYDRLIHGCSRVVSPVF